MPFERVGLLWVFMFMIEVAFLFNSALVFLLVFIFLKIVIESGSALVKVLGISFGFGLGVIAFVMTPDGRSLPAQYGLPSLKVVKAYNSEEIAEKCLKVGGEECFRLKLQSLHPSNDAHEFISAFYSIKQAAASGEDEPLLRVVSKSLPFYWNRGPEDRLLINDDKELRSSFPAIFYSELRQTLARATLADLSIQADGISFDDGSVWFKPDGTIDAINSSNNF